MNKNPPKINAFKYHQISFAVHNVSAINCNSFQGNFGKIKRSWFSLGLQRKPFECNYEHVLKSVLPLPNRQQDSAYCFQRPIIFANF